MQTSLKMFLVILFSIFVSWILLSISHFFKWLDYKIIASYLNQFFCMFITRLIVYLWIKFTSKISFKHNQKNEKCTSLVVAHIKKNTYLQRRLFLKSNS